MAAPRVKGGNPFHQQVRYRKCPECDGFMNRRNYQKSSGVIIDVCRAHGTWLDADELEQIAGFILSGGRTSPMLEAEHARAASEAAAAARIARIRVQREGSRLYGQSRSDGDVVGGLVNLLTRIFS
jgi:Zn-finger nucleic acid-binding protein